MPDDVRIIASTTARLRFCCCSFLLQVLSITMVLMGSGRPARRAALGRNARRTWAGLTVGMSTGPYVDLFTWPGGKPNTDVKSAPYHLSKSNQQREQHKCARA